MIHLWWWFQHFTGIDNTAGRPYGAFSGFFSNWVPTPRDFIVLFLVYYHHNCHEKGCPRWGKHKISGTPYCTKHKETIK